MCDARDDRVGLCEMPGELEPLSLASREAWHRLPEFHVLESDVSQRSEPRNYLAGVGEESQCLRDRHLQHLRDARSPAVSSFALDFENLVAVTAAIAIGT